MGNSSNSHKSTVYRIAIRRTNCPRRDVCNSWREVIGEYTRDLIPISLKQDLIQEARILMYNRRKLNYRNPELTNKEKVSNVQIQDLIEPCNPYMLNHNVNVHSVSEMYNMQKSNTKDVFTWIPAIFQKDKHSDSYKLISEINDLPKHHHLNLYTIIEKIFNKMVPNINRCLNIYPCTTNNISTSIETNRT